MMYAAPFLLAAVFSVVTWADPIVIDGNNIGPRFDGIGGLSGGGATSRLLMDYDEGPRNEILDFLFKPKFGASLHILKHEVGGDTFSGCGTEPSHQHERGDLSYTRGYEWMLLQEATKRNPDIITYGLPWGFPAWIGNQGNPAGPGAPLSQDQIDYMVAWVAGVEHVYNHTVGYMGVWNERAWTTDYVKGFRKALDAQGFEHVKLVVSDNGISSGEEIVQQMQADPDFERAVDVIGIHYPPGSNSTPSMRRCNKTLWSSEDSSTYDDETGGGCWARLLNFNYVVGGYTGTIMWNLVTSYYARLRWYGDSLMDAAEPWSGNYTIMSPIWASAHHTQFTQPGWSYIAVGSDGGQLPGGGTYLTYISADRQNFTIVLETMTLEHSECIRSNPGTAWPVRTQNVTFKLAGSMPVPKSGRLAVWKSLYFGAEPYLFQPWEDVFVSDDGVFTLANVEPDSQITITNTNGQTKGSFPSTRPSRDFPQQIQDNFDSYGNDTLAKYFSDMCGSFSVMNNDTAKGGILRQHVRRSPSAHGTGWGAQDSLYPLTLIGSYNTSSARISIDFYFDELAQDMPNGNSHLLSMQKFDSTSKSQQWQISSQANLFSITQGSTCVSILQESPYPIWTWPCASPPTSNQLWNHTAEGKLASIEYPGQCLDGESLQLRACSTPSLSLVWDYNVSEAHLCLNKGDPCLSSTAPGENALGETLVVAGLRLGGPLHSDPSSPPGIVAAYNSNWYTNGYYLFVAANGTVRLWRNGVDIKTLTISPPGLKTWHTMTFAVDNMFAFSATVDDAPLFVNFVDLNPPPGMTLGFSGIGSGWHRTSFDNFSLSRTVGRC